MYLASFKKDSPALLCAAAVKFRGAAAQTNFSMTNYQAELETQNKVWRISVNGPEGCAWLVNKD